MNQFNISKYKSPYFIVCIENNHHSKKTSKSSISIKKRFHVVVCANGFKN